MCENSLKLSAEIAIKILCGIYKSILITLDINNNQNYKLSFINVQR
jgi:hypothetical protein